MPAPQLADEISHCSCALPAGCWGSNGWHHGRFTRALLERRADELEARGRGNQAAVARAFIPQHIGLIYVYERCPAYVAAVKRNVEGKKVIRASGQNYE